MDMCLLLIVFHSITYIELIGAKWRIQASADQVIIRSGNRLMLLRIQAFAWISTLLPPVQCVLISQIHEIFKS